MTKEKTGVVTVLYNSSAVLAAFFDSLNRQTCRDFVLYVVDNASPDDSLEKARILAGIVDFRTVFIPNVHNGGIAQGNNLGIRAARLDGCRWVLLSNNDTVWCPDTLSALLSEAQKYRAGIAVPKIRIHGTDRIWYAGGRWNRWRGGTVHDRYGKPDTSGFEESRPVEYAPSCCMLIHRRIFDRIGIMDERFFLYYDDSDFVLRAAQAGETIRYIPQSVMEHKESASVGSASEFAQYWLSRNLIFFTYKHYSAGYGRYVLLINLLILFLKRTFTFSRAQWNASRRGCRDGWQACRECSGNLTAETLCTD